MGSKMERFEMRVDEELLQRVDAWAATQLNRPNRAEAVRRLIDVGLAAGSTDSVSFSDGEKMLMLMLKDIYKRLGIEDGECDPDFVAEAIYGGHFWAPKWKFQSVFHEEKDDPREVRYVVDVLDMWTFIEAGFERLSKDEQRALEEESGPVKFRGFDGNYETSALGIASFLIEKMNRFACFAGRDLNSHHPTETRYRDMLRSFRGMREKLVGRSLDKKELAELLAH